MNEERNERPRERRLRPRGERRARAAEQKLAPQKLKLLVIIVNRGKVEYYMDLLQSFEVNLQFTTAAEGTAASDALHIMGLEDRERALICSVIREDREAEILRTLEEKFRVIRNGKGISVTVPFSGMIGVSLYRFFCNNRRLTKEEK